jgi:hypothetical protein
MPYRNFLYDALHNLQDRIRQRPAKTPAIHSIAPMDELTIARTNLSRSSLIHITSRIQSRAAQSKRLSCTSVSAASGQSAVLFCFIAAVLGSSERIPSLREPVAQTSPLTLLRALSPNCGKRRFV